MNKGFTIVEILLSLAVFAILLVISIVALGNLDADFDLRNDASAVRDVLREAQNKTLASQADTQYGVYFNTATTPHHYILFQGTDYASGTPEAIYNLSAPIEFVSPSFANLSGQEVVFNRIQGTTNNPGNARLRIAEDPSEIRTVYVESSGNIEIDMAAVPSGGDRVSDTRHVHIDYNRAIDTTSTSTEEIILDFGAATQIIDVYDNLSGGQIVWEGDIDVSGETQTIKLRTHTLNAGPGSDETQFSIHRDRRFNTKALLVTLSQDTSGKLIEYDNTGQIIAGGESIYVSATNVQ